MIKKPFDVCFQGQRVFAFPPICISASGAAVFALNENLECSIVSPPCLVDGLFTLPCNDRPGPDYLLHLALQSLKSSSARLHFKVGIFVIMVYPNNHLYTLFSHTITFLSIYFCVLCSSSSVVLKTNSTGIGQ